MDININTPQEKSHWHWTMDGVKIGNKEYPIRSVYHRAFGNCVMVGTTSLLKDIEETKDTAYYDVDEHLYGYIEDEYFTLDEEPFTDIVNQQLD